MGVSNGCREIIVQMKRCPWVKPSTSTTREAATVFKCGYCNTPFVQSCYYSIVGLNSVYTLVDLQEHCVEVG